LLVATIWYFRVQLDLSANNYQLLISSTAAEGAAGLALHLTSRSHGGRDQYSYTAQCHCPHMFSLGCKPEVCPV
jgi:hypothetical protein